jgi:hypothetical protein
VALGSPLRARREVAVEHLAGVTLGEPVIEQEPGSAHPDEPFQSHAWSNAP